MIHKYAKPIWKTLQTGEGTFKTCNNGQINQIAQKGNACKCSLPDISNQKFSKKHFCKRMIANAF